MEAQFWHKKWKNRELGFHQETTNRFLEAYISHLAIPEGGRVFIPLCGKTLDAVWLLSKGYSVVGAELSEDAIREFFDELGVKPEISVCGKLKCYSADGIDMCVGDIFDLTAQQLGPVDAIYDRAALVALPEAMRTSYARHLIEITSGASQLLISFEYDQSVMPGPPFRVDSDEINRLYNSNYAIQQLDSDAVEGGLKGICPAEEVTWLLERQ